mmetsp:Transcript_11479/g.48192  ORF Transcript_11479/g.48192 Transcript_11479/m.48192 type:complete len:98 (+) Transcript_11479:9407-9700(+)
MGGSRISSDCLEDFNQLGPGVAASERIQQLSSPTKILRCVRAERGMQHLQSVQQWHPFTKETAEQVFPDIGGGLRKLIADAQETRIRGQPSQEETRT